MIEKMTEPAGREYRTAQSMNLECLILNPAFVNKQTRQIAEGHKKKYSRRVSWNHPQKPERTHVCAFDSGDLMIFKTVGVAALVFVAALFM